MNALCDETVRALRGIFPPARLQVLPGSPEEPDGWTVIVHPRGEGDLFRMLEVARAGGVPVRVGGRTPAGRAPVIPGGAVRIDMTGMDRILELDELSHLVRVQVGISVAVLQSRLAERQMRLGWMIHGTDAHTLGPVFSGAIPARWGARYGSPVDGVRALSAVLPDGGVFTSTPAPRRATGPDLKHLLLGTHGRLGILSEVTVRVFPWPQTERVLQVEFSAERLPRLGPVLQDRVRPHLLEVEVKADGQATLMLSLHGTLAEVDAAMALVSGALGGTREELPGLPAGRPPSADKLCLSWSAFAAFFEDWSGGSERAPFRISRVTGGGVELSDGGSVARAAALASLGPCSRHGDGAGRAHLVAVKALLDPHNLLGEMGW